MSGPILVVDSSEIRAGKLGEVKAGVEELVAFVEANEAEPLAYEIYFDEAGTMMTVVQIHPDSASLERHLTVAGPVFRRFADLLTLVNVDVYGRASEAALEQIRGKARFLGRCACPHARAACGLQSIRAVSRPRFAPKSRERDSSSVTPANDRRARLSYRQDQTIHEKEERHGRDEVPRSGASGHLSMLVRQPAFRLPSYAVRGNVLPHQALGELLA